MLQGTPWLKENSEEIFESRSNDNPYEKPLKKGKGYSIVVEDYFKEFIRLKQQIFYLYSLLQALARNLLINNEV